MYWMEHIFLPNFKFLVMAGDWFKFYRSYNEIEGLKKEPYCQRAALLDIRSNVNWEPKQATIKGKNVVCNPGECLYSLDTWSKRWRWEKMKVKRFLNRLEKLNIIHLKTTKPYTHLCLVNWQEDQQNEDQKQGKKVLRKPIRQPIQPTQRESTSYEESVTQTDTVTDTDIRIKELKNSIGETPNPSSTFDKSTLLSKIGKSQNTVLRKCLESNNLDSGEKFELLIEWLQYRKEKKKALTQSSVTKLIKRLKDSSFEQSKWVIGNSIENGWTGLFWDKWQESQHAEVNLELDDTVLPAEINEAYEKYKKWVHSKLPKLAKSKCRICSRSEFWDFKSDRKYPRRMFNFTRNEYDKFFMEIHMELNEKPWMLKEEKTVWSYFLKARKKKVNAA